MAGPRICVVLFEPYKESIRATYRDYLTRRGGGETAEERLFDFFDGAELYIDREDKAENGFVFDHLYARRGTLEEAFGEALEWERLEGKRAHRIKAETAANVFKVGQWPRIHVYGGRTVRLEQVFKELIRGAGRNLKPGALTEL